MAVGDQKTLFFVSHKHEDGGFVDKIKFHLARLGAGNLDVFTSEDIPKGHDWYEKLVEALQDSSLLLLLYTDPEMNWDYCMYESGYYAHLMSQSPAQCCRRMFAAMNGKVEIPAPFEHVQNLIVDDSPSSRGRLREAIRDWFAIPFGADARPINPEVHREEYSEDLERLADLMVELLADRRIFANFAREITLTMPLLDLKALGESEIPASTRVHGDLESMDLFDLKPPDEAGYDWEVFYGALDKSCDNTEEWTRSLARLLRKSISPERLASAGLPLYRASAGDGTKEVYRPSLHSVKLKHGMLSYNVLFTDLPRETVRDQPGPPATLALALTLGRMLLSGVLQPFAEDLDKIQDLSDLSENLSHLIESLSNQLDTAYTEAQNRGYIRGTLIACFQDRGPIRDVLAQWDALRQELFHGIPGRLADVLERDRTGRNFEAVSHLRNDLEELITKCKQVVRQFLILCARCYAEALERDY